MSVCTPSASFLYCAVGSQLVMYSMSDTGFTDFFLFRNNKLGSAWRISKKMQSNPHNPNQFQPVSSRMDIFNIHCLPINTPFLVLEISIFQDDNNSVV
jgi:hypothetical protein